MQKNPKYLQSYFELLKACYVCNCGISIYFRRMSVESKTAKYPPSCKYQELSNSFSLSSDQVQARQKQQFNFNLFLIIDVNACSNIVHIKNRFIMSLGLVANEKSAKYEISVTERDPRRLWLLTRNNIQRLVYIII